MEPKQSPIYKKPSDEQRKKIQTARKKTRQGMEARDDIFSKISPVARKMARDEESEGKEMMRKIPEPVKRFEAEEGSPPVGTYKEGGAVKAKKKTKARSGCDGIAQRGKTKGRMV